MDNSSSLAPLVLPNGLTVMHDRASKDTEYVFKEVFEQRVYLQHGVALHDDATVVDVGGHIGLFSLYALTHYKRVQVFVCEPMPRTFAALSHNLTTHAPPDSRVRLLNHGVSDKAREVTFSYYPNVPGHSTMFPDAKVDVHRVAEDMVSANPWEHNKPLAIAATIFFPWRKQIIHRALKHYFKAVQVPTKMRPLSDVIDEEKIQQIDLLKVDVEEAELDVLRGIRAEHWPRIKQAVIELGGDKQRLADIVKLLEGQGFTCETDKDPVAPDLDAYLVFARRK
jgi:phthiocerol/phenolphthiocerol synthesis type-I polyketide synthase E